MGGGEKGCERGEGMGGVVDGLWVEWLGGWIGGWVVCVCVVRSGGWWVAVEVGGEGCGGGGVGFLQLFTIWTD